jgi:hypothetical protein
VITNHLSRANSSQKNELLESEVVLRYLGSMDGDIKPEGEGTNSDEAQDDFSWGASSFFQKLSLTSVSAAFLHLDVLARAIIDNFRDDVPEAGEPIPVSFSVS